MSIHPCAIAMLLAAILAPPVLAAEDTWAPLAAFGEEGPDTAYAVNGGRARVRRGEAHLTVRCFDDQQTQVKFSVLDDAAACVSPLGGAMFTLSVPCDVGSSLDVRMTVHGETSAGEATQHQHTKTIAAGTRVDLPVYVYRNGVGPYWGMQGIPVYGPVSFTGMTPRSQATPARLTELDVTVQSPARGAKLYIYEVCAFPRGVAEARLVPHPFIDRFGQYIHADWSYKVTSEEHLKELDAEEAAVLAEAPEVSGRDAYGGWADGPQLDATGAFRTEKVGEKWWLVTPAGRLFFSMGVACVRRGGSTFVTGRDDWFAALPAKDGRYAAFYGHRTRAHSRAEAIGGDGDTLKFYGVNLVRKWGAAWREKSRERAYARLHAWGFNTIANWSDPDIVQEGEIPYTVTGHSGAARDVTGTRGYWRKTKDVFDPDFAPNTRARMRKLAEKHAGDPRVIGYFVDNEETWSGIPGGTLDSPPEQPARMAFVADLRAKYGGIAALNAAWGTAAESWEALRMPRRRTDAAREDAEAFLYRFAETYFRTIAGALEEFAPNQLYLGCRFTPGYMPAPAVRACAKYADAISINAYLEEIEPAMLTEYDTPVLIGEFHFGALDRGMFHRGLMPAANQAERAKKYVKYVARVAVNPVFVGCHWFQYTDQPTTGRSYDGENFNIGLVNVCDIPYHELTRAARGIHSRLYPMRYGEAE